MHLCLLFRHLRRACCYLFYAVVLPQHWVTSSIILKLEDEAICSDKKVSMMEKASMTCEAGDYGFYIRNPINPKEKKQKYPQFWCVQLLLGLQGIAKFLRMLP